VKNILIAAIKNKFVKVWKIFSLFIIGDLISSVYKEILSEVVRWYNLKIIIYTNSLYA